MPRKSKTEKESRIERACAAFSSVLEEDAWGDIDPMFFKWIGEGRSKIDVGEKNWDSLLSLKRAMAKAIEASEKSQ